MELLSPGLTQSIDERFTVLAPNRRAAHALRLQFGEHAVAQGRLAWLTPDILTIRAWSERLWLQSRRPGSPRLLSAQQTVLLWERIVAGSAAASTLLNPASAARAAARSWDLAQAWGISLAAIVAAGGEEAEVFVSWALQFESLCKERAWLPPGRLPHVLQACDTLAAVRIHLALADTPSPAEASLFSAIEGAGGAVRRESPGSTASRAQACAAGNPDQELLLAVQWARQQLEAGRKTVALIVPDLESRRHRLRRLLENEFAPARRRSGQPQAALPFAIAASGTLDGFPLVRAALDILSLAQGRVSPALAGTLLRSPFLAGFDAEQSSRARADVRLRAEAAEHYDVPQLERLADANECPLLAQRLALVKPLLPRGGELKLPSEWAERFLALWTAMGWPGERTPDSEEQQTRAKLQSALSGFGTLEDLLGRVSFRTACSEFQQWIAGVAFEPQTPSAPLTVLDPDSAAGMRFEALWMTGCTASRWPPAPDPDPFLPLVLQREAGMPGATAAAAHDRARQRFLLLQSAADTVICSWPQSEDDAGQSPSPFLKGFESCAAALLPGRSLKGWLHEHRPALESVVDLFAPPVPPGRVNGGARIVELQSWCPFRAQAELRLGARPLDQVVPGIDPRERGILVHAALEALWGELRSHRGLMAVDSLALQDRVHGIVDRLSAPLFTGASAHQARLIGIEVEVATRKLCELLEIERERQPFRVLDRPEFAQQYAAAGLVLDLKIDRIDVLEEAEEGAPQGEVVIDYKTGSSAQPAKWWNARPEQPQLPLYAVARGTGLAAVSFALLGARESGFKGVARVAGILPGIDAHPANRYVPEALADWQQMLGAWQQTIDALIAGFASGDARVDPLPNVCSRCHLAGFCRIDELQSAPAEGESP